MGVQIILTGKQNTGKTTRLLHLYEEMKKNKASITGFAAPGVWHNEVKTGFNLRDLSSGRDLPLASIFQQEGYIPFGHFFFNPKAIQAGNTILKQTFNLNGGVVFVDEIGKFELEGSLWHDAYLQLTKRRNLTVLTVVRESLVTKIIEKFNLTNIKIFSPDTPDNTIVNKLLSL